jgi:hypothetical protein
MKSLSSFKQAPTVILEEEKSDYSKFDMLVRAGLANKAQMQRIHKILDKMQEERPQFNNADKTILQNLFNKMVDVITNNKQIFQQTKRVVKEDLEEGVIDTADFKVGPSGRKIRAHRVVVSKNTEIEDQDDQKIKEHTEIIEEQFRGDPPNVLLLKRKAIRMYPNSTRIALYYNDRLNKYFSIPYSTEENISAPIQAEEVKLEEAVHGVEQLRKIVANKQHGVVNHRDGSASKIDQRTASAILAVHDNLNDENKKKINNMVSASKYHIQKVANFAYSKTK